jgi:hypothetical protein
LHDRHRKAGGQHARSLADATGSARRNHDGSRDRDHRSRYPDAASRGNGDGSNARSAQAPAKLDRSQAAASHPGEPSTRGDSMSTASEIMTTVGERLAANKEAAGAIGAIYKFVLEGEGGGTWIMNLKGNATLTAGEGASDCTLAMTAENGVALFEGRVSGEQLFFSNQLRVEGDMSLALRLQSLLAIVR